MIKKLDWIGLKREPTTAEVLMLEYFNLNITTWSQSDITNAINLLMTVRSQRIGD